MTEEIDLKKELAAVKERNRRVEAEKAWETSGFRIFCVAVTTYIVASLVLCVIGVKDFLLNALIPTIGYYLSTQTFPFLKRWWIGKFFT
jgi:hypothetical protein